jgi:hypothetical protein
MVVDDVEIKVPRSLLQAARDYIGSMPTLGRDGTDRFFAALRIVEPIEELLEEESVQDHVVPKKV